MKFLILLKWIFRGAIVLLLLLFALKNREVVTLYFFLDASWQMPAILLMGLFLCIGVVLALLAGMGIVFRQRREIQTLKRQLGEATAARAAVVEAPPTAADVIA